jgi:hypothetical protein
MTRWVLLAPLCFGLALSSPARADVTNRNVHPVPKAQRVRTTPARHQRVEIAWGGSWWLGEVLDSRNGRSRVHYTGWGPEWDEWVSNARLRAVTPSLSAARIGEPVEIEWHGSWWSGSVVDARNGFFKVHYIGWGPEWDEWVEVGRLHAGASRAEPLVRVTGR